MNGPSALTARCALLAVLPCFASAVFAASPAALPTVIIDIGEAGHARVDALRAADGVRFSAEFGNEMLLGIAPDALPEWLARKDVRAGPAELAYEEIVVRDLVCTQHLPEPAVAVVGGYSLVRRPAALAKVAGLSGLGGQPLPADGVVARAIRNRPDYDAAKARAKGAVDARVSALVARVDPARWHATLVALAGFDRNSFNPDLIQAHDWIGARFGEAGLQTSSHPFTLGRSNCNPLPPADVSLRNPIGFKRGTRTPDEWIVVGAHYDSRNNVRCDGVNNPQPGANDNGSGCAGVIELARVFQNIPTERSIVFACFAGEEQGLVGAYAYVQSLADSGQLAGVRHMINLDMIGHAISDSLPARVETTSQFSAELARYRSAALTYAPELSLIESTSTQAYSDHWPFIARGIPAMFTWENGASIYPHYHQVTDVPGNMSRAQALAGGILKMDTAVLAGLAVLAAEPALFSDGFEGPPTPGPAALSFAELAPTRSCRGFRSGDQCGAPAIDLAID
jgi:hypothetical protein